MTMGIAEVEEYLNSFPPGYKFDPSDDELITEYLVPKINDEQMHVNLMHDVNIYMHNPDSLAEKYPPQGNKGWYFFTSRDKKYLNGTRPNRKAGDGYWKATGADKAIQRDGIEVGFRKALVFYKGRPPKGEKTLWIMHEFRVVGPSQVKKTEPGDQVKKRKHSSINDKKEDKSMRLDDTILCRIYKKNEVTPKDNSPREQQEAENESFESQIDEAIEGEISSKESPVIDDINRGGKVYSTSNHPCHDVDVYTMEDSNATPNVNTYTNGILNVNTADNVNMSCNADIHNTNYDYGDYPSFQPFIGSRSTDHLMVNSSIYGMNVNPLASYAGLYDYDPHLTCGNYTFSEDFNGDYDNDYEQSILHLLLEPQNPTMADQDPDSMSMISERHEAVNMSNLPQHPTEEIEVKDVLPLPLPPPPLQTPLHSLPC